VDDFPKMESGFPVAIEKISATLKNLSLNGFRVFSVIAVVLIVLITINQHIVLNSLFTDLVIVYFIIKLFIYCFVLKLLYWS
jgi:hypothetical protein